MYLYSNVSIEKGGEPVFIRQAGGQCVSSPDRVRPALVFGICCLGFALSPDGVCPAFALV